HPLVGGGHDPADPWHDQAHPAPPGELRARRAGAGGRQEGPRRIGGRRHRLTTSAADRESTTHLDGPPICEPDSRSATLGPMPNRLASATSPYLLQHADNPVEWWEWSDDAFAEAARRDVPVLLSVGYA